MPAQSIAFIYKSLGCLHSIQPNPLDDGYTAPSIPALKPAGFVTWQTIQLLLGPHEHVPFMQKALRDYDVRDPVDGKPFPKELPREAFPSRPDEHMVAWHAGVSDRLRIEAQEADQERRSEDRGHSRASSTDFSADGSTDERADAAQYFSNPFNKDHAGRPAIVRALTKAAPKSMVNGGLMVANTVRNMASPFLWSRRRSLPDRSDSSEEREKRTHRHGNEDADSTPTEGKSSPSKRDHSRHHHSSNNRKSPKRDNGRGAAIDSSGTDPDSPVLHHRGPQIRRHRSHDPPQSPREYFGAYDGYHGPAPNSLPKESQYPQQKQPRHSSPDREREHAHSHNRSRSNRTPPPQPQPHHSSPPKAGVFGPSESPPFAVKVAHMQQQQASASASNSSQTSDRRLRFSNDDSGGARRSSTQAQAQAQPQQQYQTRQQPRPAQAPVPASWQPQTRQQQQRQPQQAQQRHPRQQYTYAQTRTPSYQQNRHPQQENQGAPGLWSQGLWTPDASGRVPVYAPPVVVSTGGPGPGPMLHPERDAARGGGGGGGSQRRAASQQQQGQQQGQGQQQAAALPATQPRYSMQTAAGAAGAGPAGAAVSVNGVGGRQYPGKGEVVWR